MIRTMSQILREASNLVKEVDNFFNSLRETSLFRGISTGRKEYHGEVINVDDKVMITQEVRPGAKVDVRYDGSKIIISFDNMVFVHEVGCIDKDSIKAVKKFGTLYIEARRCKDAGEDKEDIQKEEQG